MYSKADQRNISPFATSKDPILHMDIHKHARIHTFRVQVSLSDWLTHCSANCLPSSIQSLTFSPQLSKSSLIVSTGKWKHYMINKYRMPKFTHSEYKSHYQTSSHIVVLTHSHIVVQLFTLKHQSFECLFESSQFLHPYFSISELPQLLPYTINHPTSLEQEMLKTRG